VTAARAETTSALQEAADKGAVEDEADASGVDLTALLGAARAKAAEPSAYVTHRPRYVLVSAPTGLGKTHSAIGIQSKPVMDGKQAIFLTSDHDTAGELVERIRGRLAEAGVKKSVVVIEGFERACRKGELEERSAGYLYELGVRYQARGVSARKAICPNCPLKADCGFPGSLAAAGESDVVVAVHGHIWSWLPQLEAGGRKSGERKFDLMVVDEMPGLGGDEVNRVAFEDIDRTTFHFLQEVAWISNCATQNDLSVTADACQSIRRLVDAEGVADGRATTTDIWKINETGLEVPLTSGYPIKCRATIKVRLQRQSG